MHVSFPQRRRCQLRPGRVETTLPPSGLLDIAGRDDQLWTMVSDWRDICLPTISTFVDSLHYCSSS